MIIAHVKIGTRTTQNLCKQFWWSRRMNDYLGTLDNNEFSLPVERHSSGHLYRSLSRSLSNEWK